MANAGEQRLGGFRLLDSLGAGGQGTICRAVCESADFPGLAVGMTVALKVMSESVTDEWRWKQFSQMVDTLVRLDTTNVVRYYGCFRERAGVVQLHVVVMELLEGETLKERLARCRCGLNTDAALQIVSAAAAGLHAAATAGLVHRDVKPDNIFLCRDGAVKLIDFGIARREDATVTSTNSQLIGSFDYMAPERIETSFRGDVLSDVFALGVVMHQTLFGRLPYTVQSDHPEFAFFERWSAESRTTAVTIDERATQIAVGLNDFLTRALADDRTRRFADFAEFQTALAQVSPIEFHSETETYQVTDLIGRGGFGEVYRARRLRDGKVVAVKHLTRMDTEAAKRFRGEARAMAALHDPAFVKFHEYFESGLVDGKQAYLVMDCLEGMPGRSLRDVLNAAKGAGLPAGEVLQAFADYAHGLAVLHAHGIVHRDIKPSNLYFSPGSPGGAVIMDLGIALDWNTTLTQGLVPGTPDYMPPEVMISSSRGSSSADIYALGLCLYEALTGKTAFPKFKTGTSGSIEAFIVRAKRKSPPQLTAPLVQANPELRDLLRRMTDPEVESRMSNASEAELELRDLLDALEHGEWNEPQDDAQNNASSDDDAVTQDIPTADTSTADTPTTETPTAAEEPVLPVPSRKWHSLRIVASLVMALGIAGASVPFWLDQMHPAPPPKPIVQTNSTSTQVMVVTQRVVQASSIDTNAIARAAAKEREQQAAEKANLEAQLKASQEALKKAEQNVAAAEAEQKRLEEEQRQSKEQAEKEEAARKAKIEAKKAEDAKKKAEDAKKKAEAAKQQELARRKLAEEQKQIRQRIELDIASMQTSAVAIVKHYRAKPNEIESVDRERLSWIGKWKNAHESAEYSQQYARAMKMIDDAKKLCIPDAILEKLENAAECIEDEDELEALRIYAEVVAAGYRLPQNHLNNADGGFVNYQIKNSKAQDIARSRTNSNYNENTLKRQMKQARTYIKQIKGEEKGK